MNQQEVSRVLRILTKASRKWTRPVVSGVEQINRDPYRVLVSTLLSLRTRDPVTESASLRLFARADSPQSMLELSESEISSLIYPVAFYRTKARQIRQLSLTLMSTYHGMVPETLEDLTSLSGVGRKTANLVLLVGFGKPAMCVDTHVHRISNRWGFIRTSSPNESEQVLRRKLPQKYWMRYNDLLVSFGQNQCKPVSPHCSTCPVSTLCRRIGVRMSR